MSTSNHLQRVHTTSLCADGGVQESTVRVCLSLVDRAVSRMEEQQAAARKARAEMREAIRQSSPTTDLFLPLTPEERAKVKGRLKTPGAWRASVNAFLAGSGALAGRETKRAAEAGEETLSSV